MSVFKPRNYIHEGQMQRAPGTTPIPAHKPGRGPGTNLLTLKMQRGALALEAG